MDRIRCGVVKTAKRCGELFKAMRCCSRLTMLFLIGTALTIAIVLLTVRMENKFEMGREHSGWFSSTDTYSLVYKGDKTLKNVDVEFIIRYKGGEHQTYRTFEAWAPGEIKKLEAPQFKSIQRFRLRGLADDARPVYVGWESEKPRET